MIKEINTLCSICTQNSITSNSIQYCQCGAKVCVNCLASLLTESTECPACDCPINILEVVSKNVLHIRAIAKSLISDGDESLYNVLNSIRIVKENLVYIIGISPKLAEEKVLRSPQIMAQYGTIEKCIINRNNEFTPKNSVGPCFSAYITYSTAREAAIAILAIDMFEYDNRKIRASFGTTKYCSFFLKGLQCKNKECLYMHKDQPSSRMLTKELMSINRSLYQEQEMIAYKIANLDCISIGDFNKQYDKYKAKTPIFPTPDTIYHKRFHFQENTLFEKQQIGKAKALVPVEVKAVKQKAIKITSKNRFKFISLINDDGNELPNTFTQMDPSLVEDYLQFQKEEEAIFLSKYSQVTDCFIINKNDSKAAKQEKYVTAPLYIWSYQLLKENFIKQYEKVEDSEWPAEQYHLIKALHKNSVGTWIYSNYRSSKRKDKAEDRHADSTSSSANSRSGNHSDEDGLPSPRLHNKGTSETPDKIKQKVSKKQKVKKIIYN